MHIVFGTRKPAEVERYLMIHPPHSRLQPTTERSWASTWSYAFRGAHAQRSTLLLVRSASWQRLDKSSHRPAFYTMTPAALSLPQQRSSIRALSTTVDSAGAED